ncbi:MAG: molecular chaperone TorD family protein [Flaviflexus sp.]|nr:molecular chaperone TorD family protein [Flaviflexus sp.]
MYSSLPSPDRLDRLAAAFATLGRLHLTSPTADELDQIHRLRGDWPLAGGDSDIGLAELARSEQAQEDATEIRRDHNLLYGVLAQADVHPYESVHRSLEGIVFDEETLAVREAYRQLGLQAPRLNKEPDDHIGLEFSFISQSCLRALDALEADNRSEAERVYVIGVRFMTEHILQWAPLMLETAAEKARTHFYRGVMYLSLGAIADYEGGA